MDKLYIKIKQLTESVKQVDWLTKNDLFVLIIYGSQFRRTNIKWDDDEPVWNEIFLFDTVSDISYITIELYDENNWSPSKCLLKSKLLLEKGGIQSAVVGIVSIDIGDPNYEQQQEITILNNKLKEQQGTITILNNKLKDIIKIITCKC